MFTRTSTSQHYKHLQKSISWGVLLHQNSPEIFSFLPQYLFKGFPVSLAIWARSEAIWNAPKQMHLIAKAGISNPPVQRGVRSIALPFKLTLDKLLPVLCELPQILQYSVCYSIFCNGEETLKVLPHPPTQILNQNTIKDMKNYAPCSHTLSHIFRCTTK